MTRYATILVLSAEPGVKSRAGLSAGCRIVLHPGDFLSEPGDEVITGIMGEYPGCKIIVTHLLLSL